MLTRKGSLKNNLKKMSDTVLNVSEFINKLNNYISDVKLVKVDI